MKKLLFLILFLPALLSAQATFTAPIGYNTGAPTAAPSASGTRLRFDLLTNRIYSWSPTLVNWQLEAQGIDVVSGSIPPAYTPALGQSNFAINGIDSLYRYYSGAWHHINKGGGATYSAGTGIDITGNTITNTAPDVTQSLSIAGSDLTLSDGGGTVALPGGSDGNGIYGGSGTVPDGTVATTDLSAWISNTEGSIIFNAVPYFDANYGDFFPGYGLQVVDGDNNTGGFLGFTSEYPGAIKIASGDASGSSALFLTPRDLSFGGGKAAFSANSVPGADETTAILTFAIGGEGKAVFVDNTTDGLGLEYLADYSATILANDRSIPDVGTVKQMPTMPLQIADGAAANGQLYYSTTGGKLAFKDLSGTVHLLY